MYLETKEYTNRSKRKSTQVVGRDTAIAVKLARVRHAPPPKLPNNRSASLSPGTTVARRKEAERDCHTQHKEKTSLTRDSHVPVTDNPHGRSTEQRNQNTPMNPSEWRVSLRSQWISVEVSNTGCTSIVSFWCTSGAYDSIF
jgi:hypothetical protein